MWQKAVPDLRTQLDSVRLAAECGAVTCPSVPRAERTPPLAADPLALPRSMAVCADAAAPHTPWGDLRGWVSITGRALDVRRHSWRTGTSSKRCTTCSGCTQSSRCGGNGTAALRRQMPNRGRFVPVILGRAGCVRSHGYRTSGSRSASTAPPSSRYSSGRITAACVVGVAPYWISGSEPVTAVPTDPQHCPLAATRVL